MQLVQEVGEVGSPWSAEFDGCIEQVTEVGNLEGQDEVLKAVAGGLVHPEDSGLTGKLNNRAVGLASPPAGPCFDY